MQLMEAFANEDQETHNSDQQIKSNLGPKRLDLCRWKRVTEKRLPFCL